MARFRLGIFLAPGASIRPTVTATSLFNGAGEWFNTYMLGHPRNPGAELVHDFHAKVLNPATGSFGYLVTIRNAGPLATFVDVDF
jgi:hypothetical protein